MFYNFTSASIASSLTQSPRNRPKSNMRASNNTSITMNQESPIRPNSRSSPQTVVISNKVKAFKLSRRTNSEVWNTAALKTDRGLYSKAPTPTHAASLNNSMVSTVSGLPKNDVMYDLKMYDAIKQQQLRFFNRSITTPSGEPSPRMTQTQGDTVQTQRDSVQTQRESTVTTMSGFLTKRTHVRSNTGVNKEPNIVGLSPRAKLARSAKSYTALKSFNLKDAIKAALTTSTKKSKPKNSDREKLFMKIEQEKEEKRLLEERIELRKKQEREKKIKEETRVIEKIGQIGSEKFLNNLNLYNKYYAEYLNEPETKFVGLKDLQVERKPRVEESSLNRQMSTMLARKKTLAMHRISSLSPAKKVIPDNDSKSSSPAKASANKFKEEIEAETRAGSPVHSKNTPRGVDSTEGGDWVFFEKDMRRIEINLSGLHKIGSMINGSSDLTKDQVQFLQAVKFGNLAKISQMLQINSTLVKMKDLRNQTPLHWAIKRGHIQIIGELYEHGADLEALDMAGRKPMDLVQEVHRKDVTNMIDQKHWEIKRRALAMAS